MEKKASSELSHLLMFWVGCLEVSQSKAATKEFAEHDSHDDLQEKLALFKNVRRRHLSCFLVLSGS